MQIDAVLWILLPVFIAAGSALLSFYIMQARMEVAIAKERETLSEARAEIRTCKNTMEERVRATEQEARRRALDEFMQDFRVEERHYFRENKSVSSRQKAMILQERLYFRNIPLSNWVEHEMVVEQDMPDIQHLAKGCSIFSTKALSEDSKNAVSRLLEQAAASAPGSTPQLATATNNGQAA
ncbi:MAG TPA: hypothetical protein VMB25_24500 [Bryobacteraceae bacterium]|nr:hypothetical protein [Bryobacteraceae bacterium]